MVQEIYSEVHVITSILSPIQSNIVDSDPFLSIY